MRCVVNSCFSSGEQRSKQRLHHSKHSSSCSTHPAIYPRAATPHFRSRSHSVQHEQCSSWFPHFLWAATTNDAPTAARVGLTRSTIHADASLWWEPLRTTSRDHALPNGTRDDAWTKPRCYASTTWWTQKPLWSSIVHFFQLFSLACKFCNLWSWQSHW